MVALNKKRWQGEVAKPKPVRYVPFKSIAQVGENALKLNLPPYMNIHSIVNVGHYQFSEARILDQEGDDGLQ